jgi:hypothetical protein
MVAQRGLSHPRKEISIKVLEKRQIETSQLSSQVKVKKAD